VYYDTAYGNWPVAVDRLVALGVAHVRDGVYGNPAMQWRDWNEAYYRAVELAAARGIRFDVGMGRPGSETGTLDELLDVVEGRLRNAVEALEAPNEFDYFVGGPTWTTRLSAYVRSLYRKVKARPSLRRLPVVGPSLVGARAPEQLGDHRSWLDLGNIHPYTGGASPTPDALSAEIDRMRPVSGSKPVWATEAGFHNALNATSGQPPVSEAAGAVYVLRTFLENFKGGIARTYAYELADEKPEPALRDPEHHFGLLRSDFSPKPAFTALKNLLTIVGTDTRAPSLRPLRVTFSATVPDLRRLVLRKADGSYLVALWRLASVWDRDRRRPLAVDPLPVTVDLPDAARVTRADPIASADERAVRRTGTRVVLDLAGSPIVLHVTPKEGPRER
jgi:hypothetical protein